MVLRNKAVHFASDDADTATASLQLQAILPSAAAATRTIAPAAAATAPTAAATASTGSFASPTIGIGALSLAAATTAAMSDMKTGALAKFDIQLAALYYGHSSASEATTMSAFVSGVSQFANAVSSDGRYVLVDATASDHDGAALLGEMQALGLQGGSSYGAVASGWMPTASLGQFAATTNLASARESAFTTNTGSVTTQADHAEAADTARSTYGVTGAGLRIGVISDSFNTSGNADTMATDIASNDLPTDTQVLKDFASGTDEGRGMAQLIHDIAPGASIDFATGEGGEAAFANEILALARAGDKIIVDDLSYYGELSYQNSVISQAVNTVVSQGVTYFSSAANNGDEGWEGAWKAGGAFSYGGQNYTLMNFASGSAEQDYISIQNVNGSYFTLQWDSPGASAGGAGSPNDLDLFLVGSDGTVHVTAISDNINGDPVEVMGVSGGGSTVYRLYVGLHSGPAPTDIRVEALGNSRPVILGDAVTDASNTNDGTVFGHNAGPSTISVGAASYANTPANGVTTPVAETFSSKGVDHILFADDGTKLATAITTSPTFTSVDGGNTTFFGRDDGDADSLPNFYGTSAAAPDAAAAAALMLQANPNLSPADIRALLADSAIPMADSVTSGTGLIQADKAVGFAKTLTIANDAQTTLTGTHLDDTITGNSLNNVLDGDSGNDTITGGPGTDTIDGGAGNDVLFGNGGADTIVGSDGNDIIDGGAGNDILDGGADINTVSYASSPAAVTVSLALQGAGHAQNTVGAGTDVLIDFQNLTGSAYNDTLTGDAHNNVIEGGLGNDVMEGGGGEDVASYASASSAVTVSLALQGQAQNTIGAGVDTLSHFADLTGSNFADTLTGDTGANIIHGQDGNDTISAGAGADTVYGDAGDDILFGNGGADTLYGGAGNDTIDGGAGNDIIDGGTGVNTASYASAPSAVTVSLALQGQAQNTIGAGVDTLTNFQNLTGSAYNDTLSGDGNANLIHGGSGDDVIMAGAGADTVYGDPGNDTLYGNGGADILYGNGGADRLIGGAGADTLTGGAGNDTFVYLLATDSTPSAPDLITDFTHGSDKIDLSALHTSAKDTFAITSSGGITTVSVDLGGNGTVDTLIRLTGTNVVAASDVLWTTSASPAAQAADGHALVTVAHGHLATSLHAVALDHGVYG